ncbi:MAG: geranylgeranyl diphosphate synthase, type [Frankiales bacterium]|nr:geranylgeranyl diphosphate synthase, type [Frankiales bacterium]
MTESPLNRVNLRTRVQQALSDYLDQHRPRLAAVSADLTVFVDVLSDLVAGGKRLRPAFCYWGWRGAGGDDNDNIVAAATSLELLHACAIVHDDVMDASDTRRGLPSVHKRFAAFHESAGLRGDPTAFGVGSAILLGDLCLAWADEMLMASGLPFDALLRARAPYDDMRSELMAGQYLDLLEQGRGEGSVEGAMRVLLFKSAKYTVERPLHIGARLAGSDDAVITAYSAYGIPLGEAFQLRDDVLGVFGDPAETGKPAGDDLREGKQTVLVAETLARASATQREAVVSRLGDPKLDDNAVTELRAIIEDTGALAEVERRISALTARALDALTAAPISAEASDALGALATAATSRRD